MKKLWLSELDTATTRINAMRTQLASYGRVGEIDLGVLANQKGMFALLPLSVERASRLKDEFSIYMAPSGRVNIVALNTGNIPYFVSSLTKVIACKKGSPLHRTGPSQQSLFARNA